MLLIYLSCAWIAGILLGMKLSISPIWLAVSLLPLPFVFVFRQHKKLIITSALLILAVLGGIVRYQSSLPVVNENYVQYYNDQSAVELKGIISQAPDVRDKSTHIYLSDASQSIRYFVNTLYVYYIKYGMTIGDCHPSAEG